MVKTITAKFQDQSPESMDRVFPYAEIRKARDIGPAFEALKPQTDALYVVQEAVVNANRTPIITLALGAPAPTR
jgi:hypothetical protein